jgi:helix-turn-helix protein
VAEVDPAEGQVRAGTGGTRRVRADRPAASRSPTETTLSAKAVWTIEDVAVYLSRSVEAVRKMRKLNHLPPAYRVGKRLYWKREDFISWFEGHLEDLD